MNDPDRDLRDPRRRADVTDALGAHLAGRPMIVGPAVLAGVRETVDRLRALGCPVLVLMTAEGPALGPTAHSPTDPVTDPAAGAGPPARVVPIPAPATATLTEELRSHERVLRTLGVGVMAVVDAHDPHRRGMWWATPFVTSDELIQGRPVVMGRPRAFAALEDKLGVDAIWDAAGVARAPSRVVAVDDAAGLARAGSELAGPLGVVWAGDTRDGVNGGGDLVRWVVDGADAALATAWFAPRCDRVRVTPFLDGVPCSIHGFVLDDGTAVFRPVEIAMLRAANPRRFVYGGVGSSWDPPAADREAMRAVARRVGEHLRTRHGYRGGFGVDGVLTAEGFRPTELNPRMSAGLTALAEVDPWLFALLQVAAVAGWSHDVDAAELESTVVLMDAARTDRAIVTGSYRPPSPVRLPLCWDSNGFAVVAEAVATDIVTVVPTPSGFVARVQPCSALAAPGERLARIDAALVALLDRELGTGLGPVVVPPDLR